MIVEVRGQELQVGDFLMEDKAGHVVELITDGAKIVIRAEETGLLAIAHDEPVLVERGSHDMCALSWEERREVSKTIRSRDATTE